jgi:hypothetical protein
MRETYLICEVARIAASFTAQFQLLFLHFSTCRDCKLQIVPSFWIIGIWKYVYTYTAVLFKMH